jgi:hypothetical protein
MGRILMGLLDGQDTRNQECASQAWTTIQAENVEKMVEQLILHAWDIVTEVDFAWDILNPLKLHHNKFAWDRETSTNMLTIVPKRTIHLGTAGPYQFLEENPSAGRVLKGCKRVERIRDFCKTECGAIPHEPVKNLAKCIEINAHKAVSLMASKVSWAKRHRHQLIKGPFIIMSEWVVRAQCHV